MIKASASDLAKTALDTQLEKVAIDLGTALAVGLPVATVGTMAAVPSLRREFMNALGENTPLVEGARAIKEVPRDAMTDLGRNLSALSKVLGKGPPPPHSQNIPWGETFNKFIPWMVSPGASKHSLNAFSPAVLGLWGLGGTGIGIRSGLRDLNIHRPALLEDLERIRNKGMEAIDKLVEEHKQKGGDAGQVIVRTPQTVGEALKKYEKGLFFGRVNRALGDIAESGTSSLRPVSKFVSKYGDVNNFTSILDNPKALAIAARDSRLRPILEFIRSQVTPDELQPRDIALHVPGLPTQTLLGEGDNRLTRINPEIQLKRLTNIIKALDDVKPRRGSVPSFIPAGDMLLNTKNQLTRALRDAMKANLQVATAKPDKQSKPSGGKTSPPKVDLTPGAIRGLPKLFAQTLLGGLMPEKDIPDVKTYRVPMIDKGLPIEEVVADPKSVRAWRDNLRSSGPLDLAVIPGEAGVSTQHTGIQGGRLMPSGGRLAHDLGMLVNENLSTQELRHNQVNSIMKRFITNMEAEAAANPRLRSRLRLLGGGMAGSFVPSAILQAVLNSVAPINLSKKQEYYRAWGPNRATWFGL